MRSKKINDYEYSKFSQNGEDGLIDFLTKKLKKNNKFFVEFGCSNGLQNNSRNLIENGWSGIVCDLPKNINNFVSLLKKINPKGKIELAGGSIDLENINEITIKLKKLKIDFFSIDIDSYDFYIINRLLKSKILPKILCVEYNSFFGKDPLVVKYHLNFDRYKFDKKRGLYFGSSLQAWKVLLKKYNYKFICVDKNGVNAFFILPHEFKKSIFSYSGLSFKYTSVFIKKYRLQGQILENEFLKVHKKNLINAYEIIDN